MSNFPTSLDTTTQLPQPSAGNFTNNPSHAGAHDNESQAIIALETKLGTGASTPTANKVLRGTGTGTSAYGSLALTTDVTGTLPVANGGTGTTTSTGSGNVVLSTSPTFVTPALGTPISGIMTNVTGIPYGALLSSIFSGQVLSAINTGSAGGTMYYANIGGIKLLWMISASQASSNPGTAYTVILPAFFTTVQTMLTSAVNIASQANQFIDQTGAPGTGTNTFYFCSPGGVGSTAMSLIVIGT